MGSQRGRQTSYARTYRLDTAPFAESVSADVEGVMARLVAQAHLTDHPLEQQELASEDHEVDEKA